MTAKKKPAPAAILGTKALKITISGSYRSADQEVFDFNKVTGYIPYQDEDIAFMHVKDRYAAMWITGDERFKNRVYSLREVFIDSMEEVEHEFSYIGKDIREMSIEDLQDVATAYDLREVPLWRKGSVRQAQNVAYAEYGTKVQGRKGLDHRKGLNVSKLPPIVIDAGVRRDNTKKFTNEQIIAAAQGTEDAGKEEGVEGAEETLTLDDLKKIADNQGIKYHPGIGFDALYKKVYPATAA
jgi:hypothetical protein